MVVNKPYHYNFGVDTVNITKRRTGLKTGNEIFYFHNQRKIEQEVEEIKRIVVETKEVMKERPISLRDMGIKQHLDINRLSDQVYQNIEQRIRIERERRGL
jgi:Icc-related predicted phosphoesterase